MSDTSLFFSAFKCMLAFHSVTFVTDEGNWLSVCTTIMADSSEERSYGKFRLALAGHREKFTLRFKMPIC